MKLKRFVVWFIVFALLLGMVGCTTKEISYEDDLEDESPISVYLFSHSYDSSLKHLADLYNRTNPKEERDLHITYFDFQEPEILYDQMVSEISVGKGPDILYITNDLQKHLDISKLARNGSFADMDILMENGAFDMEGYNKEVLDAGIIEGKRVMMPISYKVNYLIGYAGCFDHHDLEIPEELTMETYCDLLEAYYQKQPNMPAMLGIDPAYLLYEFIQAGQPIEKTKELRRLLELLKEEHNRVEQAGSFFREDLRTMAKNWTVPVRGSVEQRDKLTYERFFYENNLLFNRQYSTHIFRSLHGAYNWDRLCDREMIIMTLPWGEKPKAYVDRALVVNINSNKKNEAFKFIKWIVSERGYNCPRWTGLPVHIKSLEEKKEKFIEGYQLGYPDEVQLPKAMVRNMIDHIESAETCESIGQFEYVYENVINESLEAYYSDFITFDELIDEMNNKLAIYYSE